MSYLVTVSFDIKNGTENDYKLMYEKLEKFGLKRSVVSNDKKTYKIPTTTTVVGEFTGESCVKIRDDLVNNIKLVYKTINRSGEFFVSVGGDWAWAIGDV